MPRARVDCAVAGTDNANSGPRTISAPSSSACCVPCWAPCGLPPSSLIRSWMLGFWNSASAISAAFFIDCAATPALPAADSGRINPTLTPPLPTACGSCGGPAGSGELHGLENEPRLCCAPEQAASSGAPRISPIAARRVAPGNRDSAGKYLAGRDFGSDGPTMGSLLLTDRSCPGLQPPNDQEGGFRHIVDEQLTKTKAISLGGAGPVADPCLVTVVLTRLLPPTGIHGTPTCSISALCAQKQPPPIQLKAARSPPPAPSQWAARS